MSVPFHTLILSGVASLPLAAGTVVITSVPDDLHPLEPLTSLAGIPLAEGTEVLVGAFATLSDDQLLDLASEDGLAGLEGAFTLFSAPCAIGQGVDGASGGFEIAVKATATAPCVGETVSLLIRTADDEFLVARFAGMIFEEETATGLEPLLSLHLADARIIVGNRDTSTRLATAIAPAVGSFTTWLAGYPTITDPALKLPAADADADGRSNFLEYATGGNPAFGGDPAPCWIRSGVEGGMWVRFKHLPGLGIRYSVESTNNPGTSWLEAGGNAGQDPDFPGAMRLFLPPPLPDSGFFRLKVESTP